MNERKGNICIRDWIEINNILNATKTYFKKLAYVK